MDPLEGYEVELLVDERKNGDSRAMALHLVSNALGYPRLTFSGFINRYAGEVLRAAKAFSGETIESVCQRAHDLHCRYGKEVRDVIAGAVRQYAGEISERTLRPGCLLRAVITGERMATDHTPADDPLSLEGGAPSAVDAGARVLFRRTTRIELALDEPRRQVIMVGLGDVGTSGQFEVISILADQYRTDLQAGLRLWDRGFVSNQALLDRLGIDSEPALRKRVSKFNQSVADLALEKWGLSLARSAVIESGSRRGYRLKPDVFIVDTKELG